MSIPRSALVLLLLACCGPSDGDTASVDCAGLDWDSVGAPFTLTYCTGCHSPTASDRGGAPPTVDLDTYEGVIDWLDRVEVRSVELGNMPPTGGPPESERAPFAAWIACGAPN